MMNNIIPKAIPLPGYTKEEDLCIWTETNNGALSITDALMEWQ